MPSPLRASAPALCFLLASVHCQDACQPTCGAQAPGDILIGVIGQCHGEVESLNERIKPEGFNCTDFILQSFVETLAVIHTIDVINDSGFLPGVRLGYLICDDCSYPIKALQIAEHLVSTNDTLHVECNPFTSPLVKAVIGARFSEVSITVARFLGLYMVPEISTSSSADTLDDKLRFPSFLRTIPNDEHQTRGIAKFMSSFSWDWVGVVYGDDDYGKSALENFLLNAEDTKVCVAYQEVMPQYLNNGNTDLRVKEVAETIRSYKAQVVLLILKEELVMKIFEEMIKTNTSRIWIASDAWSLAQSLANMPGINMVGEIFGFSFITGQNPGFSEFLQNLQPDPGVVNHFIEEYKNLRFECTPELLQYNECIANNPPSLCTRPPSLTFKSPLACSIPDPQQANDDFLIQSVYLNRTYGERLAVWAIAHALRNLLQCNGTLCQGDRNIHPWMLLQELKMVNFTLNNQRFYFNENGSFMNGYDLIYWARSGNGRDFRVIGGYDPKTGNMKVDTKDIMWQNKTVPDSKCSTPCPPGTFMKIYNVSCCYNCTQCDMGTFSNVSNMPSCLQCPDGTWSLKGWNQCYPRTETFFGWNEPYAIILLTFVGLGFLLLLMVFVVFMASRHSPVVNVAGGKLCYIMMAALVVSFGSVVLFMGKPSVHICRARQTMYGLGFTLCVSCILVKAFRTFLAFLFNFNRQYKLKKLYKPFSIIVLFTTVQVLICTFWLVFDSPRVETITSNQSMSIFFQCNEGSGVGFGIMLSYIGLLAFVCFLLAFNGRKVPHRFNETGYIIFSMLIYLFVWVCFIPIYVTKSQQRSAVQASAILVSSYGIIFCHFLPKCYMILCKKKKDISPEAYREKVRIFSITSANQALCHLSTDSGIGDMKTMATTSSMKVEVSSVGISLNDPSPSVRKRHRRSSI
ncbi:G-protein coupled receptor family C group 6 member A-like [Scleropages formosus]|uniref:G-protein coupled receptor family C group 6 member A-like n=1 Tax=Scleropages formosus TaxID=113540 RepID=UPI0010FA917C|nr:G-protein coupled receptor family C group 6 member A-like [Scleropages formosus]